MTGSGKECPEKREENRVSVVSRNPKKSRRVEGGKRGQRFLYLLISWDCRDEPLCPDPEILRYPISTEKHPLRVSNGDVIGGLPEN
jgi:hypothetical protein